MHFQFYFNSFPYDTIYIDTYDNIDIFYMLLVHVQLKKNHRIYS